MSNLIVHHHESEARFEFSEEVVQGLHDAEVARYAAGKVWRSELYLLLGLMCFALSGDYDAAIMVKALLMAILADVGITFFVYTQMQKRYRAARKAFLESTQGNLSETAGP